MCTQLVASQLGWHDERELLVATDSESFARQCARLYRDPALWHRLRENALERVRIDCSPETFTRGVVRSLAENRSSRRSRAGPGGRSSVSVQVSPAPVVHTSVAGPFLGSRSEEALRSARREIAELRHSMSWRITAPLRFVYGLFLKAGRPRSK